jgi:hypothetical protein
VPQRLNEGTRSDFEDLSTGAQSDPEGFASLSSNNDPLSPNSPPSCHPTPSRRLTQEGASVGQERGLVSSFTYGSPASPSPPRSLYNGWCGCSKPQVFVKYRPGGR